MINNANRSVKEYLKIECRNLSVNNNLIEGIESALPYASGYERTEMIVDLIKKIVF